MTDSARQFADELTIAAAPDQASVDLDDEAAILNLKTGIYFGLNEVGAWIWRLIQEPRTVAEIREAMLAEFEVEAEVCQGDLQALLRELEQNQLIEIGQAGAGAAARPDYGYGSTMPASDRAQI